jgi:hypothetical protein
LTSFLGATVIGLVIGRFFPDTKAGIPGLSKLPTVTRDIVFVLVVLLAGVATRALWFALRRRSRR